MSFAADEADPNNPSQVDQSQQGGTGLGQSAQAVPGSQTDISLGGGGTGVATPGAPSAQTMGSSTAKPSSSGSWTNLQSYLDANKDQSGQLGSQVTGAVSGQATQAQNDISQATQDFQGQADKSTVQQDQAGVNQAISDATHATAGSTYDPNEVATYQNQANASYNGPTDFTQDQYYGQAQNDLSQAQQSLQATQSEAGRDALLANQFGQGGRYNQGEQSLDQLLLEGNPSNQAAFQNLNNQWSGIGNALSSATTAGNQYAQNAQQTDAATAAAAQAALTAANSQFQGGINTQLIQDQKSYQDAINQAKMGLQSLDLTPQQLQSLGLTAGQQTWGLNLNNYLTPNSSPTIANDASADQYAQSAALAQLAGPGGAPFLDPASASQAGSALSNPYSFNGSRFNQDVSAAQQEYQNAMNSASVTAPGFFNNTLGLQQALDFGRDNINAANNPSYSTPLQEAITEANAIGGRYGQGLYGLNPSTTGTLGNLIQSAPTDVIDGPTWNGINSAIGSRI